ncbi:MAG: thioredoxin family protein [Deltaproteobacteria bacterium]|jgi:thiol:disulfide interchange protein DsbD|nr:thioredoxin family protein [Deltaproteobacteria bacterium]
MFSAQVNKKPHSPSLEVKPKKSLASRLKIPPLILILLAAALTAQAASERFRLPPPREIASEPEALSIDPRINILKPAPGPTLPPGQAAWPESGRLWLLLRLIPRPNTYFYAPFSLDTEGTDGTRPPADAVPVLRLEALDMQGTLLTDLEFYYPPGEVKNDPFSGLSLPVYNGSVQALAALPAELSGLKVQFRAEATICTPTACIPVRPTLTAELKPELFTPFPLEELPALNLALYRAGVRPRPPTPAPDPTEEITPLDEDDLPEEYLSALKTRYHQSGLEVDGLGQALLLGLIAGFILNFMPCVLPVITLKLGTLLGLGGWAGIAGDGAEAARRRSRLRLYALCFSLGILVWFGFIFALMALAGQLWGGFLQSPEMILGLTMLLFMLALGMFGLIRPPAPRLEISPRAPLVRQAFGSGLLATLLATPCSGPLLGGVLGWSVGRPGLYLGLTLLATALGMAAPFLLMVIRPELGRRLPRPGPWNQTLETVMGFVLLGVVVYLFSMLPQEKMPILTLSFLLLAFAAWLRKTTSRPTVRAPKEDPPAQAQPRPAGQRGTTKLVGGLTALALVLCALALPFAPPSGHSAWVNFTPAVFKTELGRRNLLLHFTADWCINCKALELTTLSEPRLRRWTHDYDLLRLKVDLTRKNPAGERLLRSLGGASIPFIAIIPAADPLHPTALRDLIGPETMESALRTGLRP